MYLKKITLKNIKCFNELSINFTEKHQARLWTTLFGENGLGKSTLLQAIGVVLAGPSAVRELLPVAEGWVRRGEPYGEIEAELLWTEGDTLIPGWPKKVTPYIVRYIVTGSDPERLPESLAKEFYYTVPTLVPWPGEGTSKQRENITKDMRRLQQSAYAEGKAGWLGCGYGPFRRLSGGSQDADRILYAERKSARFVTLFREDAALTNATEWLIKLYNTARDGDVAGQRALAHVRNVFAYDLFPEPIELEVNAQNALLKTGERVQVPLRDLSDGYRSMLALSIDLLRWLINAFPEDENPMNHSGVVLIDELDAHLHPRWQREIGHWLRAKFPKIQFIVATHSPFLAQVADVVSEGVPGLSSDTNQVGSGNICLRSTEYGVQADADIEPTRDLRADQIYQSPLFDLTSLYSPPTQRLLERHQSLYSKQQTGLLSKEEKQELEQLAFWRDSLPIMSDTRERRQEQNLHRAVQHHNDLLQEIA
ncbi:MAG: AAA family ATPase [Anaerolineae bacterium]|nr:AAA family ATPase [Anaerolineae bacterium]